MVQRTTIWNAAQITVDQRARSAAVEDAKEPTNNARAIDERRSTRRGCRRSLTPYQNHHSAVMLTAIRREEFAVQCDHHAVTGRVRAPLHGDTEVDRAHDAIAELFVDQFLEGRPVPLEHLVQPVDRRLKSEQDGDIVVHGSAQSVQSLIENNLVDELRLMVFPVVLGTGKRLFGETTDKKRLRLSSATVVGDGVAIQVYTRT
jgi:riboflavin biosynthesis pyrimidine reductase